MKFVVCAKQGRVEIPIHVGLSRAYPQSLFSDIYGSRISPGRYLYSGLGVGVDVILDQRQIGLHIYMAAFVTVDGLHHEHVSGTLEAVAVVTDQTAVGVHPYCTVHRLENDTHFVLGIYPDG